MEVLSGPCCSLLPRPPARPLQLAQYYLLAGNLAECKELVEAGREQLDAMADVSLLLLFP